MVKTHTTIRTGLILVLCAGLLFSSLSGAQVMQWTEAQAKRMEELLRQMEAADGNLEAMEKIVKEMRELSEQIVDTVMPEPCAGWVNNLIYACAPITVHVSQRTEFKRYMEVPPPKTIVDQEYVYAYEAEEEGQLVYARDSKDLFELRAPYKPVAYFTQPTKFRVTEAQGYQQAVRYNSRANRYEVKRFNDTGFKAITSENKTFSLQISRYPRKDLERTHLYFAPISILVGNSDAVSPESSPVYDALGIDSVSTTTGSVEFTMTSAMVKKALSSKKFTRTFRWGYETDQLGGYHRSTLTLTITVGDAYDEPGVLTVHPSTGMVSSGPDEHGNFRPSSKMYVLKNVGGADLTYSVGKKQPWLDLSSSSGALAPGHSASMTLRITKAATQLPEGTHKDTVIFTNTAGGKGSTTRSVTVDVGEEQRWRVRLTGQETDDLGGKMMYMKLEKVWQKVTVNYGIRFDFTLMAEFTIKKHKGKWRYTHGMITDAKVGFSNNFDPTVFSVTKYAPNGFNKVTQLKGQELKGEVVGNTVRLLWPRVVPAMEVTNRLKLAKIAKNGEGEGYSKNWFEANEFMDLAGNHYLPLKDGAFAPEPAKKKNYKDRHRLDKRPQIPIYHRYFMKRLK